MFHVGNYYFSDMFDMLQTSDDFTWHHKDIGHFLAIRYKGILSIQNHLQSPLEHWYNLIWTWGCLRYVINITFEI